MKAHLQGLKAFELNKDYKEMFSNEFSMLDLMSVHFGILPIPSGYCRDRDHPRIQRRARNLPGEH